MIADKKEKYTCIKAQKKTCFGWCKGREVIFNYELSLVFILRRN